MKKFSILICAITFSLVLNQELFAKTQKTIYLHDNLFLSYQYRTDLNNEWNAIWAWGQNLLPIMQDAPESIQSEIYNARIWSDLSQISAIICGITIGFNFNVEKERQAPWSIPIVFFSSGLLFKYLEINQVEKAVNLYNDWAKAQVGVIIVPDGFGLTYRWQL